MEPPNVLTKHSSVGSSNRKDDSGAKADVIRSNTWLGGGRREEEVVW